MTEADARAELVRKLAPDLEPTIPDADVDTLLATAKRPDSCGRAPSDPDWTPTWDTDAAAADGWEMKAGRALAFDFSEDGQRFTPSQINKQCLEMAALYRRGSGSSRTRSGAVDDYTNAVLEGVVVSGQPGLEVIP